jgi:hypothetical protein
MKLAIMGNSSISSEVMVKYLLSKNPNPKIDIPVEDLCQLYIDLGLSEGVKGDVAFAQSCEETGHFRFGGMVLPEMHNYGGLGATDGSPKGTGGKFPDARTGILAQIQHLKAYASTEDINKHNILVDKRFKYVTRGIAPYVDDLAGRWATNPLYAKNIYAIYSAMEKVVVIKLPPTIKEVEVIKPIVKPEVPNSMYNFKKYIKTMLG